MKNTSASVDYFSNQLIDANNRLGAYISKLKPFIDSVKKFLLLCQ